MLTFQESIKEIFQNSETVFNQALREICNFGILTLQNWVVQTQIKLHFPQLTAAYFKWDELVKNFHYFFQSADKQDAFSATLFSGATYKYESPEAWPKLIKFFSSCLQHLTDNLGDVETILDWTCDFILDTDENGKDKYWISEVNVSCIGFTNQLDIGIQQEMARELVRKVYRKKGIQ